MYIDLATINMGPGGTGKPEMSFSVTPSTSEVVVTPDEGYVFSGGIVEAVTSAIDSNIKAQNIVRGVSILGVAGTAVRPIGTMIKNVSIVPDQVYTENIYVNNVSYLRLGITGPSSLPLSVEPSTVAQSISAPSHYCYTSVDVSAVTSAIDANIHPANIRSGVSILGVTGTYGEGGGIIPSGTLSITSNGVYNVEVYASVDVSMESSPYKYLTGDITGLSLLGWDAESIGYANDNIDFYSTDASCYAVNQDDIDNIVGVDEQNITDTNIRYAPLFIPQKIDWGQEFQNCENLITIPKYDTSGVQYFGYTGHSGFSGCFAGCRNLKTIPALDTSKATDMYCMFANCSSLETVPLMDTSNVTNFAAMFRGCKSLKSVPKFDFSSASTLLNMFYKCTSLKTVPQFDLSNNNPSINYLFAGCESLEYVPALDTSNVTSMAGVFSWVIESTRNGDVTNVPLAANTATNYGLIHKLDNLKRVDGWDFSALMSPPQNFFGAYSSNAAVITPKSLPNLTHFIVNGKIEFDWNTVGQGFWMLPNLDFESIKSILQAMGRADFGHIMLFNTSITDDTSGTLQSLYDDCVNRLNWVIKGLTINAA